MAAPPPWTVPPPMAAAAPSGDWTEHKAADGRRYWHNLKTSASSWTKPTELLTARERADLTTQWREHVAADGRAYYHHQETSETRWSLPEELRVAREAAERAEAVLSAGVPVAAVPVYPPVAVAAVQAGVPPMPAHPSMPPAAPLQRPPMAPPMLSRPPAGLPPGPVPPAPVVRVRSAHELVGGPQTAAPLGYSTEDDAKAAFRQLLADSNVSAEDSWEAAMVRVIKDPRYGALPSLAKKKSAFADYVAQKTRAEREERRAREAAAREGIAAAVEEALAKGQLTPDARMRDVEQRLGGDPRWAAALEGGLLDVRGREAAVTDALALAAAKAREARKAHHDAAVAAMKSALDTAPGVTHETPWRTAMEVLGEPQGALWVTALSKAERLEVFAAWVRDGEHAAAEATALAREAQRRAERDARSAFCAFLWLCAGDGRLTARTQWKEFAAAVAGESAYEAVSRNVGGSRPRELFEDVVDELGDALSADAAAVATALGDGAEAAAEAPVKEVTSLLQAAGGRAAGVSAANLGLILGDLRAAKREKAEKSSRKARKALDDFTAMLRGKPLPVGAPWEAVRPELEREATFVTVGDEAVLKQLYDAHAAALVASGAEPGEVMALTRHKGGHRKRRRHSRSRSGHKRSKRRRSSSSSSESGSESSSSSSSSDSRARRKRKGRDKKR
jgi:pre-mRNA-processing factor 40